MKKETETKLFTLLDVLAVEMTANRNETAELRNEIRKGFEMLICDRFAASSSAASHRSSGS